jgi:23S rRNA (adenine2503-C2)-methyltransferase
MPVSIDNSQPNSFYGLTAAECDGLLVQNGWPRFRGAQVRDWVYRKGVTNPAQMTNLSARDQTALSTQFAFSTAAIVKHQVSTDGTQKLLLGWDDDAKAETVMIPDDDRRTICVSSQVGCPVGCRFCASGIDGLSKNLTAAQIVEQVMAVNEILAAGKTGDRVTGDRVNHVVFMGMGEPLANYANLMQAVRVLHDPDCLNIGARKITISTVGVPARMRQLATEGLPINLAISLHAPTESLRKNLIPWAEHFSLSEILDAARHYFDETGREVTLEYILLSGVNDRPEHAKQLARLCKTLRANVNLIRYNEVDTLPFQRPTSHDVMAFQEILREAGVNAHVRKSRGRDIDAACGQLRRKEGGETPLVQIGS